MSQSAHVRKEGRESLFESSASWIAHRCLAAVAIPPGRGDIAAPSCMHTNMGVFLVALSLLKLFDFGGLKSGFAMYACW